MVRFLALLWRNDVHENEMYELIHHVHQLQAQLSMEPTASQCVAELLTINEARQIPAPGWTDDFERCEGLYDGELVTIGEAFADRYGIDKMWLTVWLWIKEYYPEVL